jgi:hypothetical protein
MALLLYMEGFAKRMRGEFTVPSRLSVCEGLSSV